MLRPIFVDTLFVIALINWKDRHHRQAVDLAAAYRGHPLITTSAAMLEIGNGLARGFRDEAMAILNELLTSDDITVVHLSPDLLSRAMGLYHRYSDKTPGLVDCVSFAVMQQAGLREALTFDRHFREVGFVALMRQEE